MALSLDEALGMSLADEADESIHVNVNTRQITIPESQQLFGVESDADVEVKHIVIDGRYADGNRDLSKLAWRVIYRNANKETSYYLIPSVVANENSIEMDWLIKRSVVAYKGTVDFILCAFATTSSGEVTPEWNSTLGQGMVLEGLETSAIDIGKESVDELTKILYETITARDAAANSAEDADNTANSIKDSMTQIAANKKAVNQLKEKLETVKQQVANITPDDSTVGEKPWSSKHIIDMLCPPLEESGNPVECYPVAGYPLGVKASWEPTQEGSGTPYPAGGGKNLWGDLIQNTFISQQGLSSGYPGTKTTGKIPCAEGDKYTLSSVNAFASAPGNIGVIAFFDANDLMLSRVANTYQKAFTVTAPANTAYVRASCYAETNADKVQLEKGSTATEYAPYENIRLIKGRDSVTVERCGENLMDMAVVAESKNVTVDGDKIHVVDNSGWGQSYIIFDAKFPAGTYTIAFDSIIAKKGRVIVRPFNMDGEKADAKVTVAGDVYRVNANEYYKGYTFISNNIPSPQKIHFTVAKAAYFQVGFTGGLELGETEVDIINPTLVPGSTPPTTYTPYTGQTNTLTLPETVYGGEVDAVTGEGQETLKTITLDGQTNKFAGSATYWNLPRNSAVGVGDWYLNNIYSSHFYKVFGGNAEGNFIYTTSNVMTKYFPDANALNSYLAAQYAAGTPVQVRYKLAEPVPFTATGAQPIPALSGTNTVLTDANSVSVTGRADPIKRITDLEDATASQT